MNVITRLQDELATAGLRLRKAQARGEGRLTLEIGTGDGPVCAGQWHADADATERVAARTRALCGAQSVDVLAGGHLLVQRAGADRKLPVLHRLVARPDSVLVAHRAERRAVVRVHGPHYVKVVRPERTADVVAPLRQVRADGLRVPRVLDADERRGLVTLSEVAGPTLLERLADRTLDDEELATDAKRVGVAVRALHEHPAGPAREVHGPDAEVASARRWLDAASEHGLLDPSAWRDRLDDVAARLPAVPDEPALLHRDLHDKQLVLQPDEPVGLLDLDLAAYGDPALDLSNLLVHLDLRARQGLCTEARAAQCSLSLLEGYSPDAALLRRLPAYAAGTRLRLAGVYSFRAAPAGLVDELIRKVDEVGSSWL